MYGFCALMNLFYRIRRPRDQRPDLSLLRRCLRPSATVALVRRRARVELLHPKTRRRRSRRHNRRLKTARMTHRHQRSAPTLAHRGSRVPRAPKQKGVLMMDGSLDGLFQGEDHLLSMSYERRYGKYHYNSDLFKLVQLFTCSHET